MSAARSAPARLASVALVAAALVTAGCYRSNERGAGDGGTVDAGPRDAGVRDAGARDAGVGDAGPDAAGPDDAGPDAAGPDDAGPSCASPIDERARHLCVLAAQGSIPAGEPFVIPLTYGDCRCEEDRACSVRIEGDVIALSTRSCESGLECEDCAYELRCELPPLEAGEYRMRLDGEDIFDVQVEPRRMTRIARPACYGVQDRVDASFACPWPGEPIEAPTICARELEDVGAEVTITVIDPCGGCFDASAGCETRVEGRRLTVRPRTRACECASCGACEDGACVEQRVRCVSPALRDGDYTVEIEVAGGTIVRELRVRDVTSPGDVVCE